MIEDFVPQQAGASQELLYQKSDIRLALTRRNARSYHPIAVSLAA
jgi:hypothetical protein